MAGAGYDKTLTDAASELDPLDGVRGRVPSSAPEHDAPPVMAPPAPMAPPPPMTDVFGSLTSPKHDPVHFVVTAPRSVAPGAVFLIDVWAHIERQRDEVLRRAREASTESLLLRAKGPVTIARGQILKLRVLPMNDIVAAAAEDTILWDGYIASATFAMTVAQSAPLGARHGTVIVYAQDLAIAQIHFILNVASALPEAVDVVDRIKHHRSAFASYATEDRDEVLRIIQGLQKIVPDMDVFLDLASLRAGQRWEEELRRIIPTRDVFYLFWSLAASRSKWVNTEWRCALDARGLDFIDPAPLDPPDQVPPPPELSALHFNDWTLAYARRRRGAGSAGGAAVRD